MRGLLIVIGMLGFMGCSGESMQEAMHEFNKVPPTRYRFEQVILPDGTPCYVVRGGSHSGMVGITCNYGKGE